MPSGYSLIGDSGYDLSDWMMVPYPASLLQRLFEKCFNFAFSSTRTIIEQKFGRLKIRRHILLGEQQQSPAIVEHISMRAWSCITLQVISSTVHFVARGLYQLSSYVDQLTLEVKSFFVFLFMAQWIHLVFITTVVCPLWRGPHTYQMVTINWTLWGAAIQGPWLTGFPGGTIETCVSHIF